jgi:hypothetical protein
LKNALLSQAAVDAEGKIAELLDKPQRIHDVDDATLALDGDGPVDGGGGAAVATTEGAHKAEGGIGAVVASRAVLGMSRRAIWRQLI